MGRAVWEEDRTIGNPWVGGDSEMPFPGGEPQPRAPCPLLCPLHRAWPGASRLDECSS